MPVIARLTTLLLAGLLFAGPVAAHRLLVFASAVGDRIEGSAYFAGGQPARGAQVLVMDADGAVLSTLSPDADGRFAYRARTPVLHRIVAEGADGHRAEWRIEAAALAAAFAGAASDDRATDGADPDVSLDEPSGPDATGSDVTGLAATGPDAAAKPAPPDAVVPDDVGAKPVPVAPAVVDVSADPVFAAAPDRIADTTLGTGLSPAMVAAIEAAVARQVRPLREELAAARAATRLRDVLGGLGYIAGLAGLGLWWTRRRGQAS